MDQLTAHGLSFVAIDFETANYNRASVCQVGIAKVVNGTIVQTTSWVVEPPTRQTNFEPRFIAIHGITPHEVRRLGVSLEASLERISVITGDLPFVAHNAAFDKSVYVQASAAIGKTVPITKWFDTLALSRRYIQAPDYKLPTVAKALELPTFKHHEAEADAITSARIALQISQRERLKTLQQLWGQPSPKESVSKIRRQQIRPLFSRVSDLPSPNADAHPAHPLFGHHIVITGDLKGFTREEFILKVAQLGGQPQLNVTKKTTMLIVANQEFLESNYDLSKGTGKQKKAIEYKMAGQNIQIIGAKQALHYLQFPKRKLKKLAASPAKIHTVETTRAITEKTRPNYPSVSEATVQWSLQMPTEQIQKPPTGTEHATGVSAQAPPTTAPRLSQAVIKTVLWSLIVISGIVVMFFVLGLTVSLFSAKQPDITFVVWLVGLIIFMPLLSGPGLLGFFLLHRRKQRQHVSVRV